MKKIIAVLLIMTAGMAAFASGNQEADDDGVVRLERGTLARNSYLEDLEMVEVRGAVKFESPVPELTSGGKDYSLMVPGMRNYMGYISEGDRVVVTGYIIEDDQYMYGPRGGMMYGGEPPCTDIEALEGNTLLMVASIEIDGTVYELPWVNDDFGYGNRGPEGRMPGGMGRRDSFGPGRFRN